MTPDHFAGLGLSEPILRALRAEGYTEPTPIQVQAIPRLNAGKDLMAMAQTGTGKTAAFALPLLEKLARSGLKPQPKAPLALILAPTRELAIQIGDSFRAYGRHLGLKHTVILGGVGYRPQSQALVHGVHILVATTGRLLDHLDQGTVRLDHVRTLVLDEADRMLDMGFIRDVRKIVAKLSAERQTAMFSATFSPEITELARQILRAPERVEVTPKVVTVERIEQQVVFVERPDKLRMLRALLEDPAFTRSIVFTRTKRGADRVAIQIGRWGIEAEAIHGNKSQNARQRALSSFAGGKVRVLVATDIAARGLDIDDVTHVINYELPNEPESYVHRIGRTARAGADGVAISLCDREERAYLSAIEKLTRRKIAVSPLRLPPAPAAAPGAARPAAPAARPAGRGEDHAGPDRSGPDRKRHERSGHEHKDRERSNPERKGHDGKPGEPRREGKGAGHPARRNGRNRRPRRPGDRHAA